VLAPVLTFTCDEAWSFATTGREYADGSVHLEDWPEISADWTNAVLAAEVTELLRVRAKVNEAIEPHRAAGRLGKSLDASVSLSAPTGSAQAGALERHRDLLPELLIVSETKVSASGGSALEIAVHTCADLGRARCPRCWRWVPQLVGDAANQTCPRCADALAKRNS